MRRFLVHSKAVFFAYKRKCPLLRSITGLTKMKVNLTTCHYSHYNITMLRLQKRVEITIKNIFEKKRNVI